MIQLFMRIRNFGADHLEIVFENNSIFSEIDSLTGAYLSKELDPKGIPDQIVSYLKEEYKYVVSLVIDSENSSCGTFKTMTYKSKRNQNIEIIISNNSPELFVQVCKTLSIFDVWYDGESNFYMAQFYKTIIHNVCIFKPNQLDRLQIKSLHIELNSIVQYPVTILISTLLVLDAFATLPVRKCEKNNLLKFNFHLYNDQYMEYRSS